MADKRCDNGHFIDEAWDICPYCPAEHPSDGDVAVVRPSRVSVAQAEPPRTTTAVQPPVPKPTMRREAMPSEPPPMERTVAVQKVDGIPPKRYVVGWLVALSGSGRGESFPLRIGRNVLGRDRRCDVVVQDDQASAHHADLVFRPEERRFILMDHNSTNGTYVNEAEIEARRDLVGKDVIRIGSHKYLFMPLCEDGFYWDAEGALQ